MTYSPNFLTPHVFPSTDVVLGLTLGGREVGSAIVAGPRLLDFGITNLRKVGSREVREQRFRSVVERLIDHYGVTRIARARPEREADPTGVLVGEIAWLTSECAARHLPLAVYGAQDLRAALVPEGAKPTNRALADALAIRFPELWSFTPSATPAAGASHLPELDERRSSQPTDRERYWFRVFLAVAAAVQDLDQHLTAPA